MKLLIMGVGNGGCNTVRTLARQWPDGPKMAAVNTDQRAPADSAGVETIIVGEKILKGMGSAGDPRLARQAAESDIHKLSPLFEGINLAIFAVGLGGGTGSGIAPLLIEEAKKSGAATLCLVMFPFDFEGARRREQAERGLQAIRDAADGVICLHNQRLAALVEDKANIQDAFRKAETALARGIREFWRVLNTSSIINFDFADLRVFLKNSGGNCVFCCAEGSGEQRIDMALEGIQKSALINNGRSLAEAEAFIICIIGGADLSIMDVDSVVKGILALGGKNAHVMTGVGCEPDWRQTIHVTVLASEKSAAALQHAAFTGRSERQPPSPAGHDAGIPSSDMVQAGLFDVVEQGRFKGINPTIVDGNNLDIPTFIRRRIQVQKAKIANI